MRGSISLIVALIIELSLLIIIFVVMLVGLLGIFLPVLPGLLLIGMGTALYSLLVKKNYGRITPKVHRRLTSFGNKISKSKLSKKFMIVFNKSKKIQESNAQTEILRHGLILSGFNLGLVLSFLFGFIALSFLADLFNFKGAMSAYVPLVTIFIFAAASAIVWYRYGQILNLYFRTKRMVNSSLIVLISILPLLVFMLLFSGIIDLAGGFASEFFAVAFLAAIFLSVLAAVFELLIVNLGMMTPNK